MNRRRLAALIDRLARPRFGGPDEARALAQRAAQGGPWVGAFLNAHAVNLCAADPAAAAAFEGADLLLRDGAGVSLLLRLAGRAPGPNMNGTDLIPALCAGRRVALYGGRPGVAEAAARALEARGARVVAARHGFHPLSAYVGWLAEDAGAGGADLVILGLGMPRQEALALRLRAAATRPVGILCGGAVLDFLAGRVPRAPAWMRRLGLEWLFRLGLEPRRLFRRYVVGNPAFLMRAPALAAAMRRGARSGGGSDRQRPAIAA